MYPATLHFRQSVRQPIDRTSIADPYAAVRREMSRLKHPNGDGQTVAVTGSSRGIANIVPITRAVVDHFKDLGYRPFLVPAMGSHAGGTAEGQEKLLADYGLSETSLGCPVRSSMETVVLGELNIESGAESGKQGTDSSSATNAVQNPHPASSSPFPHRCPIHFDRIAAEAAHVFLLNRVKSHTRFTGSIESGLLKMLMIGLGKAAGASIYHRAIADERFPVVIRQVASFLMQKISLLGGLGIVEGITDNGDSGTACVRALAVDELETGEEELLALSKRLMPHLPLEEIDLLIVEQIGKNISGTGMDTNAIGRKFDDHKAVGSERPRIRCIAVLGLTPETAGNANGIGMAEFCLSSVLREIDWSATRLNALTAGHAAAAMVPLDYETETEIIEAARLAVGQTDVATLRIIRIRDTAHLAEFEASESLREELLRQGFEIVG